MDELNRAAEPQPIAPVSPTVPAKVRAEEPVIVPAQASPVVRELAAALSRASIAVVAQPIAPASAATPAGQALAVVEVREAQAAVHEAGEAAEDDEDKLSPLPAVRFWLDMEHWNDETLEGTNN